MPDQRKRKPESPAQDVANTLDAPTSPDGPVPTLLHRLECLLDAYWLMAMGGDHKSAELVRRLLQQQADMYARQAPADSDDGDDELAKLRARRAAG